MRAPRMSRLGLPATPAAVLVGVLATMMLLPAAAPAQETAREAGPQETAPTTAERLLASLPEVDLSPLEPAVGEQIAAMLAAAEAAVVKPSSRPAELAIAFGELGQVLHAYGLLDAAEVAYSNAAIAAPEDYRWLYYLGVLHQETGQLEGAAELLDRTLGLRQEDLAALVRRGEIEIARDHPDRAVPYLERALTLDPSCAAALAALGQVALSRREYRTAAQHLESALAALPEADRLHYPLALAYRGLGDEERARQHLALRGAVGARAPDPLIEELEQLKQGERVHILRGATAFRAGRYADAAAAFRTAVDANPESLPALINLAAALAALGDSEAAAERLRRAIEIDPDNPTARFNLGTLLGQAGDLRAAAEQLRVAAARAPEDLAIRMQLADALAAAGLDAEALLHYQAAVGLAPEDEAPRLGEANMLVRLERWSEARERLEELLRMVPASGAGTEALSRILAAVPDGGLRDGRRAVELARRVFAAQPTAVRARTLAQAHAEAGDCQAAAEWQRRAIEMTGDGEAANAALAAELERYTAGSPCRPPLAD